MSLPRSKVNTSTFSIFQEASMNLREWMSNGSQVNQIINKEDMANCESRKETP